VGKFKSKQASNNELIRQKQKSQQGSNWKEFLLQEDARLLLQLPAEELRA
jgi:hypothetical protein